MIAAVCFLFLTYLVAAVPFGLVVTTLYGGDADIRAEGSGNIGATNVARVYGWGLAGPAMGFDMGKGLVPVLLADLGWPTWGVPWLGLVAVVAFLGHIYPIYLAFHGGKGVATGAGVMLGIAPLPTAAAVLLWGVVLVLSRRSSVASLVATVVLVGSAMWWQPDVVPLTMVLALGVGMSHASNIRRLVAGDEAEILRPVRWGRAATEEQGPQVDEVLARGPAGSAAPEAWRADDTAGAGEDGTGDGGPASPRPDAVGQELP